MTITGELENYKIQRSAVKMNSHFTHLFLVMYRYIKHISARIRQTPLFNALGIRQGCLLSL